MDQLRNRKRLENNLVFFKIQKCNFGYICWEMVYSKMSIWFVLQDFYYFKVLPYLTFILDNKIIYILTLEYIFMQKHEKK